MERAGLTENLILNNKYLINQRKTVPSKKEDILNYINISQELIIIFNGVTEKVNLCPFSYFILMNGIDGKDYSDIINSLLMPYLEGGWGLNISNNGSNCYGKGATIYNPNGDLTPYNAFKIRYLLYGDSDITWRTYMMSKLAEDGGGINHEKIQKLKNEMIEYDQQIINFAKKFKISIISMELVNNNFINVVHKTKQISLNHTDLTNLGEVTLNNGATANNNRPKRTQSEISRLVAEAMANTNNNIQTTTQTMPGGKKADIWHIWLDTVRFESIKNKNKNYEITVFDAGYKETKILDIINFKDNNSKRSLKRKIVELSYFKNFKKAIEDVGVKKVLPNVRSLEDGIKLYERMRYRKENLKNCKKAAKKYGVIRIKFKLI